ncbi:MAG: thioredoxin domain-containing protein, partial [Chloroflexaceae bacterium]|nr:thioredoxin domain-containing protein [Chloroflexaceae bacterium]
HWCHVMAHESFEDEATAALMNELFVNIKVDREERPDIDSIYMAAVMAMTRHGGWPMTVFLFPDGTPFYGGTYFPPDAKAARYRMPGFKQVLRSVADAYQNRRDELLNQGQELMKMLAQDRRGSGGAAGPLSPDLLTQAFLALLQEFDYEHGGFSGAPKFPQPMTLEFLLQSYIRSESAETLRMVEFTLQKMAAGGIYDQLGGGFHRYSVDERWLVPHFEKMLYDNALLTYVFVQTYLLTGNLYYRHIAEETLTYIQREMTHPDGGFYSTQDADSEGVEGKFFVWTPDQVREVLGEDAVLFCQLFDVTARGNFEGSNILNLPHPVGEIARVTGVSLERLQEVAARGRVRLWQARERRIKPARDEKILTAWNGMMLRAVAAAARAFDSAQYLTMAQRNATFVLTHLLRGDGRVLRSWKDGRTTVLGFLEDYALLADGLLELHAADGNPRWLREAIALADEMQRLFWSDEIGGFYDTATDQEALVTRPRDVSDNATPSGNSVATHVLLRLAALTGNDTYRERAEHVLEGMNDAMRRLPTGFGRLLCAADMALARTREVALVGDPQSPDLQALVAVLHQRFDPYMVLAYKTPATTADDIAAVALLQDREQLDGKATAYVCEGFACKLPVTDAAALQAQLAEA